MKEELWEKARFTREEEDREELNEDGKLLTDEAIMASPAVPHVAA